MATPLASEQVIVQAPMSFTGSARRIWRLTADSVGALHVALITLAALLITIAWIVVLLWYCTFGLLLVPYRLIRRGSRKNKRDSLRHRETLEAISRR